MTPITIDDAVAMALSHSPALRAQSAAGDAAASREAVAATARIPRVSLTAGYYRIQEQEPLSLGSMVLGDRITDSLTASVEVVQPLYTGGAIRAGMDLAAANRRAAQEESEAMRRDLLPEVRRAYWALMEATERVAALNDRLAQVQSATDDTRNRAAAGFVTHSDVLEVEMRLAQTELQLIRAGNGRRIAVARLALLTGSAPETDFVTTTPLPPPQDVALVDLAELTARALENRSDLAALRVAVSALEVQTRAAASRRLPNLYATGMVTVARPAPETFPAENSFGATWRAGIMGRYEIGDQPGVGYAVAAARSDMQSALARLSAAEEAAIFEVHRGYLEWMTTGEEVRAAETLVSRGEEHLAETRTRAANGAALRTDELDAQAMVLEARLALTSAEVARHVAWETLLRAAGEMRVAGEID